MLRITPIGGDGRLFDVERMLTQVAGDFTDLGAEGVRKMATYPAQRSRSRYRRTGTLMRSWSATRVTRSSDRVELTIGSNSNTAPYNREVEGEDQLPLFRSLGWQTVHDLQRDLAAKLPALLERALRAGIV